MYKFEEILLGNKSELLKQAMTPTPSLAKPALPKTSPVKPATKPAFNAQGNAAIGTTSPTGIKQPSVATAPQDDPVRKAIQRDPLLQDMRLHGWGTYEPYARFDPTGRPYYIGNPSGNITYYTATGQQMTPTRANTNRAVYGMVDTSGMTPEAQEKAQKDYAALVGVDYRGANTGMPLAPGENYDQHAEKSLNNWYNNLDPQAKRGAPLLTSSQWQGPYGSQLSRVQQQWRTQQGQQPQQSNEQYLSNINAGNNLELQNARHNGQYAAGWNNWNANADALMQQQAREKAEFDERWRQADIDAANHWEDKMFKEYGTGVKGAGPDGGLTREQWDSNPELRRQAIDTVRNDRRTARNNAVVQSYKDNNGDLSKMDDYQAYADNMERIHGKAWDAREFTPEQRERFIKKDYMYNLQRRGIKPEDLIITPGVGAQIAQTAPAQPAAPPESNPKLEPLPQIEEDTTPEENTTANVDIESKPGGSYILPAAPKSFEDVPIFDGGFYPQEEESIAQTPKKDGIEVKASANIMSILFPQRARDIVKEYF